MRGRAHLFIFLIILFGAMTAPAATRTWTGADGNSMAAAGSWAEGVVPVTGDDVIFPDSTPAKEPKCDLPAETILRSVSVEGGYRFIQGGCSTRSLTTVGDVDLRAGVWAIYESMSLSFGIVYANISLAGPMVHTTTDGVFASVFLSDSQGSSLTNNGTGYIALELGGQHLNLIASNGGEMTIRGGSVDSVVADGGHLHMGDIISTSVRATGAETVIWGSNNQTTRVEVIDGARYEILGCPNAFISAEAPVLTDSVLMLPSTLNCAGTRDRRLISNTSLDPVIGEFSGFPEGMIFQSGARRFKITYRGGDGNDVQILTVPGVPFDFDSDGRADISIFRPTERIWYLLNSAAPPRQWGQASDKLVPADYDGDGNTDHAVYRPSEGNWYITRSYLSAWQRVRFGAAEDIPVPADFDGDGRADIAVFRPSLGRWWLKSSQNATSYGVTSVEFGRAGDIPVPADYDGDGRADVAVFRPENATWYIRRSTGGDLIIQWGVTGDKAVPADYDGDGKADIAVFRPSEGNWYRFLSTTQAPDIVNWGIASDQPVPADYDGDGRADVAIFRPSDGNWWLNQTTAGVMVQQFGTSEDRPVPGAFVY